MWLEAAKTPDIFTIKLGVKTIDLRLRRRSGDLFILHEIFTYTTYDVGPTFHDHVTTFLDLGAHIGLTTLYFAQMFPNARYVCVEPNSANVPLLRENVAWLGSNAFVLEAAVSDRSGFQPFDDSGKSYSGHIADSEDCGRVRSYTLDDVVALSGLEFIDILKIDIEGAERDVLRCAPNCLSRVKLIVAELHGDYSLAIFSRDLSSLGFTVIPPGSKHGNQLVVALSHFKAGQTVIPPHFFLPVTVVKQRAIVDK
jgi:FkbM family methyltransferase